MNASICKRLKFDAQVVSFKGTTLKCLLSAVGKEGFIHGISFNRKLGRNFQKGDHVSVIVTSDTPFQIALTKEYVKPLLIFDMHGVLGEREPFQKGKPRRFIRRPYCEEFIRFCAERFEIAVWSCALKKNIDLKMFNGVKLIFVWTQDESTNLYPYMSVASEHKPLFLKELSTVWDKFPSYDVTNSILLDNHIEKCEKNPLGTCVIVPDFILELPDDAVISPEGEIAQHLRAMTDQADEIHLSRYISQRAGTSTLFPLSYQSSGVRRLDPTHTAPIPSHVEAIINQPVRESPPAVDEDREAAQGLKATAETGTGSVALPAPKLPKRKRNALLVKVLSTVFGKDSSSIDHIYAMQHMPISPHRHLFRRDLQTITTAMDDYVLCDSLAGATVLVVVDPGARQLSLLFSDLSVHKVSPPISAGERAEFDGWLDGMSGGMSVFIAELGNCASGKQLVLSVLDVALLNGSRMCEQGEGLLGRVARASGWLFSSPLDDISLTYICKPLLITCKEYTPVSQVSAETLARMGASLEQEESADPTCGSSASPAASLQGAPDGLVFTAVRGSWQDHVTYQWKPLRRCTVDVSISLEELAAAVQAQQRGGEEGAVSVRGVYQHEAKSVAEAVMVAVSPADIPREVTRVTGAGTSAAEVESCLVACRLVPPGEGLCCDWAAVQFHPLAERRLHSAGDMRGVRRLLAEDLRLSELFL